MVEKMTQKLLAIATIAFVTLVSGAALTSQVKADIVNGVATQDLFQNATVGRRGSVDSGEFSPPDSQRPTGSSGIVGFANTIEVGPVLPDPDLPFSFPGTTAIATATGFSSTTFNAANDIQVRLLASSSIANVDSSAEFGGSYGANVLANSYFSFQVDETTQAMIAGAVDPRSVNSDWQVRLSGGPAGFVFNRFTDSGGDPLSFSSDVTLFAGFNYFLQANVGASASASPGDADSGVSETINFRFGEFNAVPEPGAAGLVGFVFMLAFTKRKKRLT